MSRAPESLSRRIAANSASLAAARGAGLAISFAFGLYVIRALGVEEFGRYSVVMAAYTLLTIFVNLGLESLVVREVSRAREETKAILHGVLRLKLVSAGTCCGVLAVAAVVSTGRGLAAPLALVGLALVLDAIADSASLALQGHERFRETSVLGLAGGALFALLGSIALLSGGATTALVAAFVVAKTAQAIASWSWMKGVLGLSNAAVSGGRGRAGALAKAAIPFFFAKLFYLVYFKIDVLMLDAIVGEREVGLYGAAYKFVSFATAGAAAFTAAMFPVMASAAKERPDALSKLFADSARYLIVAGAAAYLVGRHFAEPLTSLLFGAEYLEAAPVLALLSGVVGFVFVNLLLTNMVLSTDREWLAVPVGAATALLNVALNVVLIPRYGAIGAGWATLASELFVAVAYVASLPRPLAAKVAGGLLRVAPAAIAAHGVLAYAPLPLAARAALAAVAFAGALTLTGGFAPRDAERVRAILAPRDG